MNRLINLIKIPKVFDDCLLYFVQRSDHISFPIKRVYFVTKPASGLPRGLHAHKKTDQALFCIQGRIKLILDNGKNREEITLDDPKIGVILPKMVWHEMHEILENTIILVLASRKFDPTDYIRDYQKFKNFLKKTK